MEPKAFNKLILQIIRVLQTLVFFFREGRPESTVDGLRACAQRMHECANQIEEASDGSPR